MKTENYDNELSLWIEKEKTISELSNVASRLILEHATELVLFRNRITNITKSEILNLHDYAAKFVKQDINVHQTLNLAKAILKLGIKNTKIDLGKLTYEWIKEDTSNDKINDFVMNKLSALVNDENNLAPKDVILYGFGRIGRLVARELFLQDNAGGQLRLRAIVTRSDSEKDISKRASLLRTDSVHGIFTGTVKEDFENKALIINGRTVNMIAAKSPDNIDYTEYGIKDALVIDNTGIFRDKEALSLHLKSKGVAKVLLTAPGKGVPNIVFGVNHKIDIENTSIFSAASCTTNAITPILKVVEKQLGIVKGHLETIHAYTNDQNLVDNMHNKYRRGRAAALNMVITETGAGKAVTKAIPSLEGKLTSSAIRVPTPNGSLAILNLTLEKETNLEDINKLMYDAAFDSELVEQIRFSVNNELVSSDIVGDSCSSIYDSPATQVSNDGKSIVLYIWYDNEYGYTRQVLRLAKHIAKVRRKCYY
ncbi:MAG: glyceraldehyde-3-phosphate dehydrogenase [Flavobacteriales bacterium]|nr:glyceraldehyde-3-phosphate dehydrogenase [Flavobacteriales bacterium]|tara:strand:- start:141 stop:1583 length:1443 start_codon:yes stop_codon:yes gene_type:complete